MSEEAVVRIILQDGTAGTSTGTPAPPASPSSPTGSSPPPQSQQRTGSHPPSSPSPPSAGSPRPVPLAQQVLIGGVPHQAVGSAAQSRPNWVNELISGFTKSIKDLATQLVSSKPSATMAGTTQVAQAGGIPQLLQSLQQAQTSLPQFTTSVIPPSGTGTAYRPQSQLSYTTFAGATPSSQSMPTYAAPPPQQQPTTASASDARRKHSEASKRGWENRRRKQADRDRRWAEEGAALGLGPESDTPQKNKRRTKSTTAGVSGAAPAMTPLSPSSTVDDLWNRAEASVAGSIVQEDQNSEEELSSTAAETLPAGVETPEQEEYRKRQIEGESPKDRANRLRREAPKKPRMADGGFLSKLLGLGQKEQPTTSAEVPITVTSEKGQERYKKPTPIKYDPASWQANNKLRDALRAALAKAGYHAKDASALASDQDILRVWGMNASHMTPEEALAKLRQSGVLGYGPYDAPHFMREFERHKRAQETALGRTLEEIPSSDVNLSIPQAPPPPLPGVRLNKSGEIILARKRAKPFFKSGGGELPRMADGGQVEVPVGQAYVPPLSEGRKRLLGRASDLKFTDPYFKLHPEKLLEIYHQNKPVPLPPTYGGIDNPVDDEVARDWADISRLMPGSARAIKAIVPVEEDDRDRKLGTFTPDSKKPTGTLSLNPDRYNVETLWHELIHAEQHRRGTLLAKPGHDASGELTTYGQVIESEAYQRGLQGKEVLGRLRHLLAKENKSGRAEVPMRAAGGPTASMAIVGDLPGQSIESIKSDPHTEVIMGNQVISHNEALRHGLFDGGPPRYAVGGWMAGLGRMAAKSMRGSTSSAANIRYKKPRVRRAPRYTNPVNTARSQMNDAAAAEDVHQARKGMDPGYALTDAMSNLHPIAAAVQAVTAGIISTNKAVIGGASGVANWAASAEANPGKDISQFSSAVADAGESLSKISPVAGIVVSAFGEAGKALGSFMQAMDKTVERYGEVSPQIAQQQAMGEIRQIMGDMRRAQEAGPEIVRYMQNQQDMQQKFEDIKIKLLNQILQVVNPILEAMNTILPQGEALDSTLRALVAPLVVIAESVAALVGAQQQNNIPQVQDPADIMLRHPGYPVGQEAGVGR